MPADLLSRVRELRLALAAFDADLYSGADCALLAEELAAAEKACETARVPASSRAVRTGAHRERGSNDGATWMARQSGTTTGQARPRRSQRAAPKPTMQDIYRHRRSTRRRR